MREELVFNCFNFLLKATLLALAIAICLKIVSVVADSSRDKDERGVEALSEEDAGKICNDKNKKLVVGEIRISDDSFSMVLTCE